MKLRTFQFGMAALFLVGLAGCGGSSSSTTPIVVSTNTFTLQSAYKKLINTGQANSFSVSGTCSGSGFLSTTAATPANFVGASNVSASAVSATSTLTMTISGASCTPSTAETSTAYFYDNTSSSSYSPLGVDNMGSSYGVFQSMPNFPQSVKVGDNGILGVETLYTDVTQNTVNGSLVLSYVIQAETATTAIVNLVTKTYNFSASSNTTTLILTRQDFYRIDSTGTLTPISSDLQHSYTSAAHLLLTYSTASVASTLSFPLQTAYNSLIATGMAHNFTVSGTCGGSGYFAVAPATTPANFVAVSGVAAVSAVAADSTLTISVTAGGGCTPSTVQTSTAYFNNNSGTYTPLGINTQGVNYGVFPTFSSSTYLPASVKVGATGILGTLTLYTDSTETKIAGTLAQSYLIATDTSTTALVNFISRTYNASGSLTLTQQDLYRIAPTGINGAYVLTPISADLQYASGYTSHLLLTYY